MNLVENFKKELRALLRKYNTALEADDEWIGYPECGQDIQMTASIYNVYDKDGYLIKEGGVARLGRYFTGFEEVNK